MISDERKDKLEAEIGRGFAARSILNDSVFIECFDKLEKGIVEMWAACPARDTAGREWLWMYHQAAMKFKESLNEILNTGKLAIREREMSLAEKVSQKIRSIA